MKKRLKILMLVFLILVCASYGLLAQNDSFFYEMYSETDREEGLSFAMLETTQGKGLNFIGIDLFASNGEDGFAFVEIEEVVDGVPVGSGMLLLITAGVFYARRKNRK